MQVLLQTWLLAHSDDDYLFHLVLIINVSVTEVWFPVAQLWEWIK